MPPPAGQQAQLRVNSAGLAHVAAWNVDKLAPLATCRKQQVAGQPLACLATHMQRQRQRTHLEDEEDAAGADDMELRLLALLARALVHTAVCAPVVAFMEKLQGAINDLATGASLASSRGAAYAACLQSLEASQPVWGWWLDMWAALGFPEQLLAGLRAWRGGGAGGSDSALAAHTGHIVAPLGGGRLLEDA